VKAFSVIVALGTMILVPIYLLYVMARSIREERRRSHLTKVWANFGLSVILCLLFFATWAAHGVVQWQRYAEEQRTHGEPVEVSGYLIDYGGSTLENWQSEFLQLFSFVVLAAAYIHRGSAESKDSDDRMEQMLTDIKKKLDA
jgi:branched-subunit amino acid ABC-type transport system permease component